MKVNRGQCEEHIEMSVKDFIERTESFQSGSRAAVMIDLIIVVASGLLAAVVSTYLFD